jgi:hypothetical protein
LEVPGRSVRLSALGLRRDPHGSVKQIHHEELEDGEKERPSAFPKIMLKQTDSGIQQLAAARERAQDQQRRLTSEASRIALIVVIALFRCDVQTVVRRLPPKNIVPAFS